MNYMSKQTVSYYGVHWDPEGIAFLEQGKVGGNAIGWRKPSPFQVQLPTKGHHCNHQIPLQAPIPNLTHTAFFDSILDDPLVRVMLPIPKTDTGVYFVAETDPNMVELLVMLSTMSSPIFNVVSPMWSIDPKVWVKRLYNSNIQPQVLHGVRPADTDKMVDLAQAAATSPSKLIFSGSEDVVVPRAAKRITTRVIPSNRDFNEILALPWESLGAYVLRKYMRRELEL
ncbi:hypothetical protein [Inquilinus limosus]|uniref:Uncharacterized protein n=1 Tax=Inquilinus limosus MP06 TaxID=1398085 RepID=A0A0A0DDH5_9PROT|nr:hypothetical protein [Inquilinus limosus]KGM36095.1 hypothetical protein P409_00140 [Inquilinus limosus MP06]